MKYEKDDPFEPSDDLEFVLGRQSQSQKTPDKLTRAHYITVDLIHTGRCELSFVIAIAEEISSATYEANAVILDITTAAQRRAFNDQRTEFQINLGLVDVTRSLFSVQDMPTLNSTLGECPNCIIGLEDMYKIILDLRLHEHFNKAADAIEKILSQYVRFEETDEPAPAPPPPEPSIYHGRYNTWGSW